MGSREATCGPVNLRNSLEQHPHRVSRVPESFRPSAAGLVNVETGALLRLAGAVLVEAHDEWADTDRRYLSERSLAQPATMTT